jgi:hypothetical protein
MKRVFYAVTTFFFLHFSIIFDISHYKKSQDRDGQWVGWPRFDSWQGLDFSPLQNIQTGSGAYPPSYTMDNWDVPQG